MFTDVHIRTAKVMARARYGATKIGFPLKMQGHLWLPEQMCKLLFLSVEHMHTVTVAGVLWTTFSMVAGLSNK